MIALFHIIYWSINQLYKCFQTNALPQQTTKCDFDVNFFEETKVKYSNAIIDAEIGLKFDPPVYLQRYTIVQELLLNKEWRDKINKVVDFGCAELKFFKYFKNSINVQNVLLVDIDEFLLENNCNRVDPFTADYLSLRKLPLHVEVLQGSIDFPDYKLLSVDAVICIEIIEHLYPDTLDALPHNIFYFMEPRIVIFTTPNADFNVLFNNFSGIRHYDHKFEWSRQQFQDWANNLTLRYPKYSVYFVGIGSGPIGTENFGCCSQMAVFIKNTNTTDDGARLALISKYQKNDYYSNCVIEQLKDCFSDLVSYGVCTYQSYINNNYRPFILIKEVDYPYNMDSRTEEEIILHETQYLMYRLGSYSKNYYYNENNYRTEIPLYKLTVNNGGEYISIQELRNILEKAGYIIEECKINNEQVPCVIYEDSYIDSDRSESQSPELNYSTDVNWDSESQWDLDTSTDPSHINMEMGLKKTESIILWDETSNQQEHPETTGENESPISDPCVSGEHNEHTDHQTGSTDEKVELLFDSGYQVSTSSIDLSPDFMKDWLQEEKNEITYLTKSETEHAKQTRSEKTYLISSESIKVRELKSEAQVKLNKKVNKNEEPVVPINPLNRVQNIVVPAQHEPQPQPQIILEHPELPEIVENGDLANNNRDREGNNYQAAENLILDDNAILRPENLDEHNENHIVLDEPDQINEINAVEEQIGDFQEEDENNENIDGASREVQFDQNSQLTFSDESLIIHGIQLPFENYNILLHATIGRQSAPGALENPVSAMSDSQDTFQTTAGFPVWLLQLLNMSDDHLGLVAEDAHFFSQGDGLGIHPSTININDDESTSSSEQSANSEGIIAIAATPSHPNSTTATLDSDMDMNFYDAIESNNLTHVILNMNEVELRAQNHFAQIETQTDGNERQGTSTEPLGMYRNPQGTSRDPPIINRNPQGTSRDPMEVNRERQGMNRDLQDVSSDSSIVEDTDTR